MSDEATTTKTEQQQIEGRRLMVSVALGLISILVGVAVAQVTESILLGLATVLVGTGTEHAITRRIIGRRT